MMVKVKVCGITRLDDAIEALLVGADLLGFILYPPSPRAISVKDLTDLTKEIHHHHATRMLFARSAPPLLVGVFVNEPVDNITRIIDECGLDLAQLSGDETSDLLTRPTSPIYRRVYKALRPRSIDEARRNAVEYTRFPPTDNRPRLLLDTPHGTLMGGTGERGDWDLAREIAATIPGLMLAGGLTPNNVSEAVRRVRPFAVDVASGVELTPGIKDRELVREFIHKAKSV